MLPIECQGLRAAVLPALVKKLGNPGSGLLCFSPSAMVILKYLNPDDIRTVTDTETDRLAVLLIRGEGETVLSGHWGCC